ncbi:MAG: AAA family ATPase [Methanomassiliicoccales archaeon]|nr:AAA family ATPase [Methanomassiliicoccales archaeon]
MTMGDGNSIGVPRVERLVVQNYRALKHLDLKLQPITFFLGPNGSGKSTIFDVFAFLSECFTVGLRKAWEKRNRFKELRTRDQNGPIIIELKYRENRTNSFNPLITYHLAINENDKGPYVEEEFLSWKRGSYGKPFKFLEFKKGEGSVVTGEQPDETDERRPEPLSSSDTIAVNTLGQLKNHPRVSALRSFITDWHLSYLSADAARGKPESGAQEHLSTSGDNLPNVIQYLKEQHIEIYNEIMTALSKRVPKLEKIDAEILPDGRLMLQIKDAPFRSPVLAKYASDGTIKMLAYMTLMGDPNPPQLVGIEEPENFIHPSLLTDLAEEFRKASQRTQLLVTSHSPFIVNEARPDEVYVLYRDASGFTQAKRASDMENVLDLIDSGGKLGDLWMERFFEVGYPSDGISRK